jgi:hypothetical protein
MERIDVLAWIAEPAHLFIIAALKVAPVGSEESIEREGSGLFCFPIMFLP